MGIDKNPDTFGIDEIISKSEDSLITIGMHKKVGDSLKLTSMEETMFFYENQLIGFSINTDKIKLNETNDSQSSTPETKQTQHQKAF